MKVLAVGAHPDDIELMCGGTLAALVEDGAEVYNLILSDGELCMDGNVRREEARRAADLLGIKKVFFLGLPDGRIPCDLDVIRSIEQIIDSTKPDLIFTHTSQDQHQDHRNTTQATLSAARNHQNILLCESPSSHSPLDHFISVDISSTIDRKLLALAFYKAHLELRISLETIMAIAKYRGFKISVDYAETFHPYRYLMPTKTRSITEQLAVSSTMQEKPTNLFGN